MEKEILRIGELIEKDADLETIPAISVQDLDDNVISLVKMVEKLPKEFGFGLSHIINENSVFLLKNMTKDEENSLFKNLIKILFSINSSNASRYVSDIILALFSKSNCNAEFLLAEIMKFPATIHVSRLFASIWNENRNLPNIPAENLVSYVLDLIEYADLPVKSTLLTHFVRMKTNVHSHLDEQTCEKLWVSILEISKNQLDDLVPIITDMTLMFSNDPFLREYKAKCIERMIGDSLSIHSIISLIPLFCLMPVDYFWQSFRRVISYLDSLNDEQIIEFIDDLSYIYQTMFNTKTQFNQNGDSEKTIFPLPFFEIPYQFMMSNNVIFSLYGLRIIEIIVSSSFAFDFPDVFYDSVFRILCIEFSDEQKQYDELLLRFIDRYDVEREKLLISLINIFPDLHCSSLSVFFYLYKEILKQECIDDTISSLTFDFAYIYIRKEISDYYNDYFFKLLSYVCEYDSQLILTIVDDIIPIAYKLVKSQKIRDIRGTIKLIRNISYAFGEHIKPKLHDIPFLLSSQCNTSNINSIESRFMCMYADIVLSLHFNVLYNDLFEIVCYYLKSELDMNVVSGNRIARSFLSLADHNDYVHRFIEIFIDIIMKCDNTEYFHIYLSTIVLFMRTAHIYEPFSFLFDLLMKKSHPIFANGYVFDSESFILDFLLTYSIDNNFKIDEIINYVINVTNESDIAEISPCLDAVCRLCKIPAFCSYAKIVFNQLHSLLTPNGSDIDSRIIDTLMILLMNVSHDLIDINMFIAQLIIYWKEEMTNNEKWRAALGTAILQLCSLGAEMIEEEIEDVLIDFPFDNNGYRDEAVSQALLRMMDDENKWKILNPIFAKTISDFLIQRDQFSSKSNITHDTETALFVHLLNIFENSPNIKSILFNHYSMMKKNTFVKRFMRSIR